jgi:hypothetical protein
MTAIRLFEETLVATSSMVQVALGAAAMLESMRGTSGTASRGRSHP